jgi:hypothetical protein
LKGSEGESADFSTENIEFLTRLNNNLAKKKRKIKERKETCAWKKEKLQNSQN